MFRPSPSRISSPSHWTMRLPLAPLLPLALSFGCIGASAVPHHEQLHFLDLPVEMCERVFKFAGLLAYATAQKAIGDSVSLVTSKFELELLSDTTEEIVHLGRYEDNQRARLSAILEATRFVIGRRSELPPTIPSDIPTLEQLAAQLEVTFLEYASLSSSSTWARYCMIALLDSTALIKLLPFLSEGFVETNIRVMLQATAVMEDFDEFRAVANNYKSPIAGLRWFIEDEVLSSGNVDFVRQVVEYMPCLISDSPDLLMTAIKLNHRSLFEYLYEETIKQPLSEWELGIKLRLAFEAIASRGWEDLFELLYSQHPQCVDTKQCLIAAANHGRINILKLLLIDNKILAEDARPHINSAFEAAVGSGNIETVNFFLGYDESGNSIFPNLRLTQPISDILTRASRSGRWDGIDYLMQLKSKGDVRFAELELVGDGREAARTACLYGNLEVLKQLLQTDDQGHFVFTFGESANLGQELLNKACFHGHLPIVQELLKYSNVNPAANSHAALVTACKWGNHLVVQELLRDKRVDADAEDNEPLIAACRGGHLRVVRELLHMDGDGEYIHNVDPAARNNQALIFACEKGNRLVVRELLQHKGVDPAAKDNAALIAACRKGHLLVVCELLQKDNRGKYIYVGINPATGDNRCLIDACRHGRSKVVEFLLQGRSNAQGVMEYEHAGVDAAAQDNMALLEAIKGKHTKIVEFLLQKTESGGYRFPGIAVTERMRQTAASLGCPRLQHLLDEQCDAMRGDEMK